MGERKRRQAAGTTFLDTLTPEEKIIADVASATLKRFVLPYRPVTMCYRLAYFLHAYLAKEHGISTEAVIGYLGSADQFAQLSHAWVEFNGKKTDLSLAYREDALAGEPMPPGEVLILDHIARPGVPHAYTREETADSIASKKRLQQQNPRTATLFEEETALRALVMTYQGNLDTILSYLNDAPDGVTYDRMARIIEGTAGI